MCVFYTVIVVFLGRGNLNHGLIHISCGKRCLHARCQRHVSNPERMLVQIAVEWSDVFKEPFHLVYQMNKSIVSFK